MVCHVSSSHFSHLFFICPPSVPLGAQLETCFPLLVSHSFRICLPLVSRSGSSWWHSFLPSRQLWVWLVAWFFTCPPLVSNSGSGKSHEFACSFPFVSCFFRVLLASPNLNLLPSCSCFFPECLSDSTMKPAHLRSDFNFRKNSCGCSMSSCRAAAGQPQESASPEPYSQTKGAKGKQEKTGKTASMRLFAICVGLSSHFGPVGSVISLMCFPFFFIGSHSGRHCHDCF